MADQELTIDAGAVIDDEQRLALDGYWCELVLAEHNQKLAMVRLTVGQQVLEQRTVVLDEEHHTRDLVLLRVMLEYMNTGGDPDRIRELAAAVAALSTIQATPYTLLGVHGRVDWTSYYRDDEGKIFEVYHGLFTNQMAQEEFDELVDERDTEMEPTSESSTGSDAQVQSATHSDSA